MRGAITTFRLPGGAIGIAATPDGDLWMTEFGRNRLVRFRLDRTEPN